MFTVNTTGELTIQCSRKKGMTGLEIRKGKTEDFIQVDSMLDRIWGKDDYVHEYWQQWVEDKDKGIVLVAEFEGKIIGTTYVSFMPGNDCWFQAIRVDPDYRRLGAGSKLTYASLEESKLAGLKTAYLGIDGSNEASIKMTERMGFKGMTAFTALLKPAEINISFNSCNNYNIREAQYDDIPKMFNLAASRKEVGFVSFWRWYTLSHEMLHEAISEKELWLAEENNEIRAFFGYFKEHDHPIVFAPIIEDDNLGNLLSSCLEELKSDNSGPFEIWLSRDKNERLIEELVGLEGFTRLDDYIIWHYRL